MCKAYRDLKKQLLQEGREEGRAEGRAEGRTEGKVEGRDNANIEHVRNMIDSMKCSVQEAFRILKIPESEQAAVLEKL